MSSENSVGLAMIGVGALIIVLCVPLLQGRIKPNGLYGMRLPKSFESEANWFKINRFGARKFIGWSLVLMLLGIVACFLPLRHHAALTGLLAFSPAVLVLIAAWQTYRYSETL